MKLKTLKKAWVLDLSKIDEGYLFSEKHVHAKTRGSAKSLMLSEYRYENLKLLSFGEDVTFLNIPIFRDRNYDIVSFNSEEIMRYEVDRKIAELERNKHLDSLLSGNVEYFYIMKRGYYYMPNSCGYTSREYEAGVYNKEYAVSHAKCCDEIFLIPIDIEKHNSRIKEVCEIITKNLIN